MSKAEMSTEQRIEEVVEQEESQNETCCNREGEACSDCPEAVAVDEDDGKEVVQVYLEELEALVDTIAELEADEDIVDKIEKTLFSGRNIYLQGVVNEESISHVVSMIHYYNLEDDNRNLEPEERENIKLYISSEGGELIWCKRLLSAMENSKCKIETISEGGQIASAGLVIFLAGDIRKLSRHSEPMYHNLSAGVAGSYSEMDNQMNLYRRIQQEMDDYIVEMTEIPLKKLQSYRKKNQDWHITFNEAKKYKMFDIQI